MNNLDSPLSIHNIITELNKNSELREHITIEKLMISYGGQSDVTKQIQSILKTQSLTKKDLIIGEKFEINKSKLWTCKLSLRFPKEIIFKGMGISKKTAEYNSKLAALLWLKEVQKLESKPRSYHSLIDTHKKQISSNKFVKSSNSIHGELLRRPYSFLDNWVSAIPVGTRQNLGSLNYKEQCDNSEAKFFHKSVIQSQFHKTRPIRINKSFIRNVILSVLHQNNIQKRTISTVTSRCGERDQNSSETVQETVKFGLPSVGKKEAIASSRPNVKEIYYEDCEEDIRKMREIFPNPKNCLHNYFDLIADELKDKSFKVNPNYKLRKRNVKGKLLTEWLCMYHIKWPEEIKFYASGDNKKLASTMASQAALLWLNVNKKMTENCLPLLHTKEQIKEIKTKTIPSIALSTTVVSNMNNIINLFEETVVPYIIKKNQDIDTNYDSTVSVQEPDNVDLSVVHKQRYLGLETYTAKEKVALPIAKYKEDFIKLLDNNNIIIVKGEPGCGKSTRVPQYVLEAWAQGAGLSGDACRIAVTQPRRIAAISLAKRVSMERDEAVGNIVGYQVRLQSEFRPMTGRILYCTTGILIRQLQHDPRLTKFTHIILDEAHERDANTDLLMNLLRSALKNNLNLKLIVMSATIDADAFKEYFEGAPIMQIPGFTYPVRQHFLESFQDIDMSKTVKMCASQYPSVVPEDVLKVIRYIHKNKREGAILVFLPGWDDISKVRRLLPQESNEIAVYCLHSRLQDSEQWKIFSKPPPGVRKIILATNIAETSVTIDDVVYVVDSGIEKDKRFDIEKGISCIDNHWISKASATQRKGRAGRVQPGESFHLYPRSKYESLPEYSLPEILCTSLTKIVLDSKVFSNNMDAVQFMNGLLTPPDKSAVLKAVEELKDLELLDADEKLTSLGRTLAEFQLEPKLAKVMVNAVIFKCVTPIVDIVTLFSSESELFTSSLVAKEEINSVKKQFSTTSDHLAMMRIFEKWLEFTEEGDSSMAYKFCKDIKLAPYKLDMIEKLKSLHFNYIKNGLYSVMPLSDDYSDNDELVKAVLLSGVGTILQHRNWDIVKKRLKNNVNVYLTRNNHKATITMESVNYKKRKHPSNFMVYINETRSNIRRTTLIRETSLIAALSVLLFTNKNLKTERVPENNLNSNVKSKDIVKITMENSNIEFLCDKGQAEMVVKCRDAMMQTYQYFIYQLTQGGEYDAEFNENWDKMLQVLDQILNEHKI